MYNQLQTFTDKKNILTSEPMSKHTSFKIGGNADFYVTPSTISEFKNIVSFLKSSALPYIVIGNGSNLLVSDKGIEGVVISTEKLLNLSVNNNTIYADAGVKLSVLAAEATKNSLSGLEFAQGIPGSVGGAVYMNAGAYDGEMKNAITSVTILSDDEIISVSADVCDFGYRTSVFQKTGDIILGAEFLLEPGNKDDITAKVYDFASRRKLKQPLEFPSAGSAFKRPEGFFAGKLIEDAGLRGFSVGGAQVSEKHCGFIINKGGATATDVLNLIKHIKTSVYVRFGIKLHEEIKFIGRR